MEVHVDTRELAALESRAALAEAVSGIAASIASNLDLGTLVPEVVGHVKALLRADAATVFLRDPATGELIFHAVDGGAGDEVKAIRLAPDEGVAGWVATRQKVLAVADVEGDPRFSSRVDDTTGFVTRTIVAAPLFFRGDLVGVLEAVNRSGGEPFGETDGQVLAALAPHVAVAVQNARATGALRTRKEDLEREVQKRIQQIIRAKKEWEQTIDSIEDPIVLVQEDHTIRRGNLAVARRAAISVREVPGKACHALLFGRESPCPGCPVGQAFAGQAATAEIELEGRVHIATHFPLEAVEGEVKAVVCTYRDITASREMEHRLRETERMASVGQLAAGVAHEINNPMAFLTSNLSTLRGYFEDLAKVARRVALLGPFAAESEGDRLRLVVQRLVRELSEELDLNDLVEDGLTLLDESTTGAARVTHIVKQLKSFAREKRSAEEDVRVADSAERAAHSARAEFPGADIVIESTSQRRVRVCPISLDQAFSALLRNALQAAPGQPVEVHIADTAAGVVEARVEDRGPGIEPSVRSRIFDPFFTTRGIGGGLGLGLSTVYAMVRRHHGTVEVRDRPGGGTAMVVTLPVAEPAVDRGREAPGVGDAVLAAPSAG